MISIRRFKTVFNEQMERSHPVPKPSGFATHCLEYQCLWMLLVLLYCGFEGPSPDDVKDDRGAFTEFFVSAEKKHWITPAY